jgi:hypothetical protein
MGAGSLKGTQQKTLGAVKGYDTREFVAELCFSGITPMWRRTSVAEAVTASKDDAPAAVQAAMANVAGSSSISAGGGLIQTTSG